MNNDFFNEIVNNNYNRRSFLKKSTLGLLILSFTPYFISSCTSYPPQETKYKVFNNKEAFILSSITEIFISSTETGLPDPIKINLVKDIDEYISTISKEAQSQFKSLLNIFEDFTFLFSGSLTKFTSMSLPEKNNYINSWANSKTEFKQMAYKALKMSIMLIYYSKDETWGKIEYSGAQCTGGTNDIPR